MTMCSICGRQSVPARSVGCGRSAAVTGRRASRRCAAAISTRFSTMPASQIRCTGIESQPQATLRERPTSGAGGWVAVRWPAACGIASRAQCLTLRTALERDVTDRADDGTGTAELRPGTKDQPETESNDQHYEGQRRSIQPRLQECLRLPSTDRLKSCPKPP